MRYKYVGDGPYPLYVYGIGVVNAKNDVLDTDEPINHKHFVEVTEKKPAKSEGEK